MPTGACQASDTVCRTIHSDEKNKFSINENDMKKSLFARFTNRRSPFTELASLPLLTFVRSVCCRLSAAGPQSSVIRHPTQPFAIRYSLFAAALLLSGCQVLTYHSPTGERFTRSSMGSSTAISSLTVEANTNGFRRVKLQGYTNDSTTALGTVTEAAVKAAMQSVKP
jgi:hypothetical protein